MLLLDVIPVVTKDLTYKRRSLAGVEHLVIHRCGLGYSARDIHLAFRDKTKHAAGWYTGGKFPYHFLVRPDGQVEQCLPLTYIGPAALRQLNESGIHIACVGDMRKKPLTPHQATHLLALCEALQEPFNWDLTVRGHTEDPGATADPEKDCPGHHLNLKGLRSSLDKSVVRYLQPDFKLVEQGFVL